MAQTVEYNPSDEKSVAIAAIEKYLGQPVGGPTLKENKSLDPETRDPEEFWKELTDMQVPRCVSLLSKEGIKKLYNEASRRDDIHIEAECFRLGVLCDANKLRESDMWKWGEMFQKMTGIHFELVEKGKIVKQFLTRTNIADVNKDGMIDEEDLSIVHKGFSKNKGSSKKSGGQTRSKSATNKSSASGKSKKK